MITEIVQNILIEILGSVNCMCLFSDSSATASPYQKSECYPCSLRENVVFASCNFIRGLVDKETYIRYLVYACNVNNLSVSEVIERMELLKEDSPDADDKTMKELDEWQYMYGQIMEAINEGVRERDQDN